MHAFQPSRRALLGAGACLSATAWAGLGRARAADPTRVVGVLEETPAIINPAITAVINSYAAGTPVYNALTHIDAQGNILPELAQSWDIAPDGLTFTFHLRRGVKWHDGEPFSAADVKWSLLNANGKLHPWGRGAFRAIETIDTPDDATVVLHLKQPSAALMYGTDAACGCILPRHIWDGTDVVNNPHNLQPIGTGPFKFVEMLAGDRVRYVRNPDYFVPGRPGFDELVFRIIPDPPARVAAFENGEVDTIYSNALPFSEAPRLGAEKDVTLRATNLRGAAFLGIINVRNKPYSDVRVRQAVAHAIDRGFLRDNVDKGFTVKMLGPVPPASPLYDAALKDYDYDPALANKMLDEAGYPKGADGTRFAFNLLFPAADAGITRMGDVIRQNLQAVGVDVVLQPLDRAALQQKGYIALQFDMIVESYGLGPDPDIGVERLYNSHNIFTPPVPYTNVSGYVNSDVDKLFDEQRVQLDVAQRKATYAKIQQAIWADVPVLPMFSYNGPNVYHTSAVTGLYEGSYGNIESYAAARPPGAAPAASPAVASSSAAGTAQAPQPVTAPPPTTAPEPATAASPASNTAAWTAGAVAAVAVVAGGVVWTKRRAPRDSAE